MIPVYIYVTHLLTEEIAGGAHNVGCVPPVRCVVAAGLV